MAATPLQTQLRRRHSRCELTCPVEVTVLRSGIPQSLPGRIVDAGLGGISVVLSSDLYAGETVGVEFQLTDAPAMVQARARVRYQGRLRSGLEFSTVSPDKLELVRLWTDQRHRVVLSPADMVQVVPMEMPGEGLPFLQPAQTGVHRKWDLRDDPAQAGVSTEKLLGEKTHRNVRRGTKRTAMLAILLALAAVLGVGVWVYARHLFPSRAQAQSTEQVPAQGSPDPLLRRVIVAADVMQSLITYRSMPVYPKAALQRGIQGTVLLDTVVGKDGRVLEVRPESGPPELASAAVDAVKNWRFSPFTLNGDAVEVETTIAVEFRLKDR